MQGRAETFSATELHPLSGVPRDVYADGMYQAEVGQPDEPTDEKWDVYQQAEIDAENAAVRWAEDAHAWGSGEYLHDPFEAA